MLIFRFAMIQKFILNNSIRFCLEVGLIYKMQYIMQFSAMLGMIQYANVI